MGKPVFTFRNSDGVKYEVIVRRITTKNDLGYCDNPALQKPQIVIKESIFNSKLALRVIIEEWAHAFFWDKKEKEVRPFAKSLAKFLLKNGWTKKLTS